MSLSRLLLTFWGRRWLVLGVFVTVTGAAIVWMLTLPQTFTATVDLVIDPRGQDPINGRTGSEQAWARYSSTQVDVIRSRAVTEQVAEWLMQQQGVNLQAVLPAEGDKQESLVRLAGWLHRNLEVEHAGRSSVLSIRFEAEDRRLVAIVANAYAQAYLEENLRLRTGPAEQFSRWYEQRLASLRDDLERAQTRLSDYQESAGIIAVDERLDIENAQLAELASLVVSSESERLHGQSRERQLDAGDRGLVADVLSNHLVQSLRADIARAETKLDEMSTRLGANHPQYRQTAREVDALRERLGAAKQTAAGAVRSSTSISQTQEAELRQALELQRQKVMSLNHKRNQLTLLYQDVANAQERHAAALQRASEMRLESELVRTDVAVLNRAVDPRAPAGPDYRLLALLGGVLGGLLGLGVALALELLDQRVRSAGDLESALGLPVLAAVPAGKRSG